MCDHPLLIRILHLLLTIAHIDAKFNLLQKIPNLDTQYIAFGKSVSISNNYCVIRAATFDQWGAVHIYRYNLIDNEWNHTQILHPDVYRSRNKPLSEHWPCGRDVAIFENTIVISCAQNKAYIYKLNEANETWYKLTTLTTPLEDPKSDFGYSVDITDGYAIIGDYWVGVKSSSYTGIGHIFIQTFDEWTGQELWIYNQTLYPNDSVPGHSFTFSVSISDSHAIIGADMTDDNGLSSGGAYIFELNKDIMIWEQVIKLLPSDGVTMDFFGNSVLIDSILGFAIVGAPGKNDSRGVCYVYQRDNDSGLWNQTAIILNPNQNTPKQYFGQSIAIYGDTLIIGADDIVYEYKLSLDAMRKTVTLQNVSNFTGSERSDDVFGQTVDIFGDFVAIAAPGANTVYIYQNQGIAPPLSQTNMQRIDLIDNEKCTK